MTQKLCRQLEDLEKISAAAAALRARTSPDVRRKLDELSAIAEARRVDPEFQKLLAEMPPEIFTARVQSFREELWQRAYGNRQAIR